MSKQQTKKQNNQSFEKFFEALGKAMWIISHICYFGVKQLRPLTLKFWFMLTLLGLLSINLAWVDPWHFKFLHYVWPQLFSDNVMVKLSRIDVATHFWVLYILFMVIALMTLGINEYRWIKKIKNTITDLGFETKSGAKAKLIKITELGEARRKLTIASGGAGIERFTAKRSDLAAGFGQIIEEIQVDPSNLSNVEIFISERDLSSKYNFSKAKELLEEPYSFVVGQSFKGPIVQNIRTLPHMFMAGTTGGGKSTFFNNVILGLMNSSEKIRFYLIDLKNGLEVQDYKDFPNVEIAKSDQEAVNMLSKLNKIMDQRFSYLEKERRRNIDPIKDDKDIIIVAIDEVSEAFDTTVSDKEKKKLRTQIYEQAHRLSKLSRAAGFHLIFSTQKIKKQLMPTEIQTNIGGRMCFKLPNSVDSVTAIGNKKASELPDIKGRAIWHQGNNYTQVQAPYLGDGEIKEEIRELKDKFSLSIRDREKNEISEEKKIVKRNRSITSRFENNERPTQE